MPRSPSRDLSDRFNNNRAYFRRLDSLRWSKYALSAVALLGVLGWVAADIGKPVGWNLVYSHGPLARVHATWDNDCSACHRDSSGSEIGVFSIFQTRARWRDLSCERCHAGATHHANATPESLRFGADCANCHHDHGGRDNALTRIADSHCTVCHTNLNHATQTGSDYTNQVTNFVTDHPQFRALSARSEGQAQVNRTLKFSHALHMTAGLTYLPDGKGALTPERIAALSGPTQATRYARPDESHQQLVRLECSSCHQLDSGIGQERYEQLKKELARAGQATHSVLPARPQGAYYLPVNFEAHCRACHPIQAPEQTAGSGPKTTLDHFDLSHHKQAAELKKEIQAGYLAQLLADKNSLLAVPAGLDGRFSPPANGLQRRTIHEEVEGLSNGAMTRLLSADGGCRKCHDLNGTAIAAVSDHTVLLQHSWFNHASHRAVSCAECHPNCNAAFAPGGNVVEKEPLQITGIDSCRACHAPVGTLVERPDGERISGGGARHNCVDCHRYHNGDHGLQGRGANAFDPRTPLSVNEFLRGK